MQKETGYEKDTTPKQNQKALTKTNRKQLRAMAAQERLTVGLDLGDRNSRYCILAENGEVASEDRLPTTKTGLSSLFEKMPSSRVALEEGTHSPWESRHLAGSGHEVIVANPHKVKLIPQSERPDRRAETGAAGPEVVLADPASGGSSASAPGGDPCAGGVDGGADGADQPRAGWRKRWENG